MDDPLADTTKVFGAKATPLMGGKINSFVPTYHDGENFSGHSGSSMLLSSGLPDTHNDSWRPLLLAKDGSEVIIGVLTGSMSKNKEEFGTGTALTRPVLDYFHECTEGVLRHMELAVKRGKTLPLFTDMSHFINSTSSPAEHGCCFGVRFRFCLLFVFLCVFVW